MPLMECEINGKKGWKYGESGKCYESKQKAVLQGAAIARNSGEKLKLNKAEIKEMIEVEYKTWTKEEVLKWLGEHNLIADIFEETNRAYVFYQTDKSNYEALRREDRLNYDWQGEDDGINTEYIIEGENVSILKIEFRKKLKPVVTKKLDPIIKNEEQHLLFGWAYISHDKEGNQLYDHSGEFVKEENFGDLEMATYAFNMAFRESDIRHDCEAKGRLVESMVFSKEKQKTLGIPEGILPQGVWVGFFFEKDEDWEVIKSMEAPMFSLFGAATKEIEE